MLKVRLLPVGKKNQPKYRIVVAEARSKRNGKYVEKIGFYDPLVNPAKVKVDKSRYDYWLSKGAKPTKTVRLILEKK